MNEYNPEAWVVLKFVTPTYTIYKVLAGWYGGYTGGDYWKLNSGITKVEVDGDYYLFHGYSGSVYKCHKEAYRLSSLMTSTYDSFQYQVMQAPDVTLELMPSETNFLEIEYT